MISRVFRVQASGTGSYVDWSKFATKGVREEKNPIAALFVTTTIPNTLTDLFDHLASGKITFKVKTIFPNGPLTTSFDILIECPTVHILCGRRLVRGLFPLNPIAPEFGKNYDLMLSLSGDESVVNTIIEKVIKKYQHSEYTEAAK